MSEQTPDTNNGISDAQEPSMEDILASIRKIIAEDDVQPSADLDSQVESVEADSLEGDVSGLAQADYLDLDVVEEDIVEQVTETNPESDMMDIDALLGDMDVNGGLEEQDVMAPEAFSDSDAEANDVLDLMIPMGEARGADVAEDGVMDLALDDELEVLMPDIEATDVAYELEPREEPVVELAAVAGTPLVKPIDDDLSLMLDNMLEDSPSDQDFEVPATEDLLDEIDLTLDDDTDTEFEQEEIEHEEFEPEDFEQEEASQTDPDIDLVKSLMADLTEQPLHDNVAEDAYDVDIDEVDDSGDVMDEILSMTLDDETQLSENIEIAELDTAFVEDVPTEEALIEEALIEDVPIEEALIEVPATESLSLKDIAAAAEAEADASGGGLPKGVLAGLGAAAIGGVAVATSQEEEVELETLELETTELDEAEVLLSQLDDILDDDVVIAEDQLPEEPAHITPEHITPELITEETPPMARTNKKDAIIDEVTEEATAGAFASLTNVVETKAVTAERGDRIGDLVQDALRPMLKEWLDKNLKSIVERAVTKEVKRISSGK